MKLRFAGMEEMQQNIKSQKVEDGTDWTNEHHKIADQADIPALGLFKVSLIHVICGNGELAHIIKEVIEKDLRGQHRQKWQEDRSSGHTEHISKVRAGAHQQILHHVAKGFAPLDDAFVQDPQARLNENDIGSLASHIRCAGHGMPTSAA